MDKRINIESTHCPEIRNPTMLTAITTRSTHQLKSLAATIGAAVRDGVEGALKRVAIG